MPDDDGDDELGETSEKLGGIAGRFGSGGDTTETSETTGTTDSKETNEVTETSETTETTETSEVPAPGDDEFRIREHWNGRTIYLSDDDVEALDLLYQELSLEWRREHGGELAKNDRFYPAVVRVALEHPELIREELGLDE